MFLAIFFPVQFLFSNNFANDHLLWGYFLLPLDISLGSRVLFQRIHSENFNSKYTMDYVRVQNYTSVVPIVPEIYCFSDFNILTWLVDWKTIPFCKKSQIDKFDLKVKENVHFSWTLFSFFRPPTTVNLRELRFRRLLAFPQNKGTNKPWRNNFQNKLNVYMYLTFSLIIESDCSVSLFTPQATRRCQIQRQTPSHAVASSVTYGNTLRIPVPFPPMSVGIGCVSTIKKHSFARPTVKISGSQV